MSVDTSESSPTPQAYTPSRWPFFQQVRWQIMLLFVALVGLTLIVTEFMTFPRIAAEGEQQVFKQLNSIADLKYDQVRFWLESADSTLALFLTRPLAAQVEDLLTTSPVPKEKQAALNATLEQALNVSHIQGKPLFARIFVYTTDGKVIASSDAGQVGKVVSGQPYFASSLKDDEIYRPHYPLGSKTLTLVITQRRFTMRDNFIGVVAGEVNIQTLADVMLQRSGLDPSGETYLVSRESNFLLTPSRFDGYPLTRAYHSVGIDDGLRGNSGAQIYTNYRGESHIVQGVYRWMPELDAVLVAEIEQADALEPIWRVQRTNILTTVAIGFAAALLGLLFANRLTTPIRNLTAAATQLAQGNLDQRASVSSSNEFGQLSVTFNMMADQLRDMVQGLEQRIAARTTELRTALDQREQVVADLQEALTVRDQLNATIRELSSPVLPLKNNMLVLPLVGVIDSERAQTVMERILQAVEAQRTKTVLIDVTGVPFIDTSVAQALMETANALRLLGAKPILVGLRPELAQTIVGLGIDFTNLETYANLQSALAVYQ